MMKKLLILLLAMMLTVSSFVMASCDKEEAETPQTTTGEQTTEEQTTEEQTTEKPTLKAPTGYQLYNDGHIAFAYPVEWSKTEGSTVLLQKTGGVNNITVVYVAKTDYFEKLTTSTFISEMKPAYSAMGMTISDEAVTQVENEWGTKITKITYTATVQSTVMKQTQLVTTVGERTYTVTFTEGQTDANGVQTLFDTLSKAE